MKKRLLSILLALCMVICLVPTSVFAESETNKKVETEQELVDALSDSSTDIITLKNDIAISTTLTVDRAVTLDVYGYMLEITGSGSVINIKSGGHLTLKDSDPTVEHRFVSDNGLWKLDEISGTETVRGGVIYGGTGTKMYYSTYGGGVLIEPGGAFTMNGGSIVGCKADGAGGGVVVQCGDANGIFTMNSGAIIGCVAESGGGVETDGGGVGEYGQFIMNGGVIDSCVANGRTGGGGVRNDGLFIMGKDATIKNCKAVENGQRNIGSGIVLAGDERQTIGGTIISEDVVDEKYIFMNRSTMAIGESANIHANITLDGGKIDLDGSRATVYGKITNDSYGGVSCFADGLVTVNYKVNGEDYAVQILRSGSFATRPIEPTKTGYEFDDWFVSDGTKWDYNTAVTENITLTGSLYIPVTSETELRAALADDTADVIRLTKDIDISSSLTVLRKVTLDLNGYVLKMTGSGSVIILDNKSGITGDLTLIDSNPTAEHKFKVNGAEPWVLDNSGTETVYGGIITGGTGSRIFFSNGVSGGGVIIGSGALTMNGGNIVGCIANRGGGLFLSDGSFTMNAGSIVGCSTPNRLTTGEAFHGGIYAFGPMANADTTGVITLTGGLIKNNGRYDINAAYMTTIYANGGEVYSGVHLNQSSKITCLAEDNGITAFKGKTVIGGTSSVNPSHVDWGLFYGGLDIYGNTTGVIVTYKDGDSEHAKQVLPSGTLATRPDDPTATPGYTFGGWNKADGTAWDYASDKVTDNITLYAKWIANTYTVTFDTAGGTEIAPITQGYGTAITAPAAPTREGYTFIGWDTEIPTTMPAENMTVTAQWKINKYTITFDTAGGTEIAPITQDYGTQIASPAAPTREGYNFVGWDKSIPATMPAENITITAQWKDTEKPTGEIIIGTNKWQSFLNKLTFGLFFKDTQEVTINAADNSGAVFISYFVTDQDLSEAELGSLVYYAYDEPFCIDPNGEYIIYAMLVDESLNITYLRSDRITLDNVRPVITGIENGKTYCEAQTVTVDEKYVDTVTVNGTEVELDEEGSFTLAPANGKQKIIAADKAGNTAEMTVTVNDGHTFGEWKSNGDGTHTRKCTADGCNSCETKNCSGGKATCAEKAICELCGKAYGELNASNHTNLVSFPAKAATTDAEGNIEYWRCEGCGKYFADSAGTKEITAKDTVTGKLPSDKKSPQTGASGMLALCAALLLTSGGTAAVISTRKKKKFGKAE
ncbi:MAG: InlB B-repeat-containing protein [Anaerotruncus sp.]|nr:InlB B-repeat-containing protein [Anaerotruncus sp.]